MPRLVFTTFDVFTSARYIGNPLAIVHLTPSQAESLTQSQKLAIAKEFNLSETVFLHLPSSPSSSGPANEEFKIDIFTTASEIPFAGHPTIGAAFHVLVSRRQTALKALITKAGRIPVFLAPDTGLIAAEIPHNVHIHALTIQSSLSSSPSPVVSIVNGMTFCYVPLPSLVVLAEANFPAHEESPPSAGGRQGPELLDEGWRNGFVGTMYYVSQGSDERGWKVYRTRMWGGGEDPATGSASSGLAAFLALTDAGKGEEKGLYKYAFIQGVEMGRESRIFVEVVIKDGGVVSIKLSGTAVKVMEGTLEI